MSAAHTPGPWEVRASRDTVDFGIIVHDASAEAGWAVIAEAFSEIRHAGERAPEALANARLITAAPDYHAAAASLLAWADELDVDAKAEGFGGVSVTAKRIRVALGSAHAKATGSTS